MLRGSRVANAHIGVTVDGDGINEEIVDEVEKAEPGVERAGHRAGERYGDGFSGGFFSRMRQKFGKQIGDRLNADMDHAGKDAGEALGSAMVQSARKRLRDADDLVAELGEKFDKAMAGRTTIAKLEIMESRLKTAENQAKRLTTELHKVMEAEGMLGGVSGNGRSGNGAAGGGRNAGIGGFIGSLFGGGSRNNFLNIMGKSIGGLTSGIEGLFKVMGNNFVVKRLTDAFAGLVSKSDLATKILGGGAGGGGKLAGALGAVARAGPAAAVALIAVGLSLTIFASVAGAVVGILTAMAATITGGLLAAITALGGVLGTAAVAGGLLALAFTSMTDAQRKYLNDAFKPLKAEMTGLGQIIFTQFNKPLYDGQTAIQVWSANLQKAFMQLVPVAQVGGKALAEAGNALTASFSGPGFQLFAQALTVYLPGIIKNLGSALGSFLNGLLGVFAALMPYISQFSAYLSQVAARFAKWATSAEGQNSIVTFADRAVQSLKSLWGFVSAFFGFLGNLLFSPQAMTAGNTIFDGMAKKFKQFSRAIDRAQADGSLKKFFDDAIRFGGNLWAVIEALFGAFRALYSSGVLNAIGDALGWLARIIQALTQIAQPFIDQIGRVLPLAFTLTLGPISNVIKALGWVGDKLGIVTQQTSNFAVGMANTFQIAASIVTAASQQMQREAAIAKSMQGLTNFTMPEVQDIGTDALNLTSVDHGGYKPKKPKKFRNPWKAWANSLINEGPSTRAAIKAAVKELNAAATKALRDIAAEAGGEGAARESIASMMADLVTGGKDVRQKARDALNNAARDLANASNMREARAALKRVNRARQDMANAIAKQKTLNNIANTLAKQKVVHWDVVGKMVAGGAYKGASLADYAAARFRVAAKLEAANEKLVDALALRDDYKNEVMDSIKSFASLATAQAQTLDGVEQALTATDITTNLQARLDKIRKFQTDLQLLLAQGLSNDAYKQIVDEGVEGGGVLAQALLAGGSAAIQQTNSLVSQINGIAGSLGTETSNRLYQAGVSAAQGLVDGLTSLSAQLDSAATKLGNAIAASVKKALGIKSPSSVLRDMMGSVGDGTVLGLQDQHVKVGSAAAALAGLIAVNPGGSRYSTTSEEAVSGNGRGQLLGDLHVHTPTADPTAVAIEAVNELVGRL